MSEPLKPSDWVLVPREPTREMIESGAHYTEFDPREAARCVYEAMYDAAPRANTDDAATAEAKVERLVIRAYQAGYGRGHNDTVEGCYNAAVEHEPDAALEWMREGE